ncbi:unnamed protein product [Phytophthora lilii]|uniref:Unnamed protein product n=1 Tax=Phytophthora lilii TaxID=2077276 RepID=A0A9W6U330_9STRA|nr:unnamed protein product [Phytophthora lilii]
MQEVSQLVYLEAALKETLRLHPSAPMLLRSAVADTTLSDGTFVPKNSWIILAPYVTGRLTSVWGADAKEFKPERWIDPTTGKLIHVSAYKFPSFNSGLRMCLGMNLAMLEMKLVAGRVLSKFHVAVQNPEKVTYDLSLTLPVRGSLDVKISPALSRANPDFLGVCLVY